MSSSLAPRSNSRDYIEAILWAVVITLLLRTFVIQAFRIPSESMCDTLLVGDFLFVNKLEYGPKVPYSSLLTNRKSPTSSVSHIDSDGIRNAWMTNVRRSSVMTTAHRMASM